MPGIDDDKPLASFCSRCGMSFEGISLKEAIDHGVACDDLVGSHCIHCGTPIGPEGDSCHTYLRLRAIRDWEIREGLTSLDRVDKGSSPWFAFGDGDDDDHRN